MQQPAYDQQSNKGYGDQLLEEDTTGHTSEHPGFGHTDGGKIQIPGYST